MIELKDIEKTYPNGTVALKKVSIKIEKGDFVILSGESGAGKTTLLKIIHGEENPTSGSIFYNGEEVNKIPISDLRRKIGFAYQDFMLIEDRTVVENITLPLQIKGESFRDLSKKSQSALKAMNIEDKTYKLVRELSGGEKQRVSIARALIANPEVLMLDEPTGNLDIDTATEVMKYIEAINEQGATIIMATHHMFNWGTKPKKIIRLKDGRVVKKEYV
jgi:cell division transport system ATP-binding protein